MSESSLESDQGMREHILSSAAQLFMERGFSNVSIRDICDRCDVTPPTIYHYFGSKDRLFQAVIRKTLSLREFKDSLFLRVAEQTSPDQRLTVFIDHYISSFPRDFFNPGLFLQYSTQVFGVTTERVMSEFLAINVLAAQIIQEGVQAGIFRPVDIEQTTLFIMNLLMAYVLGEVHYGQQCDAERTPAYVFDMLMHGLQNQS
jgi:AcrR family transcriptional regulator